MNATRAAIEISEPIAPVCGAEYPLISPGEYTLQCVDARIYRHPGLPDHPWKAQLQFRDGFDSYRVFGFFHLGVGDKPHAGRRSRYWQAWGIANGGPARKRQTMSPRVFRGVWFRVKVETISERHEGKERVPLPAEMHYSVVREILARAH